MLKTYWFFFSLIGLKWRKLKTSGGKKAEQKPHSQGAPDSGDCAAPTVRVLLAPFMPGLSKLGIWLYYWRKAAGMGPERALVEPLTTRAGKKRWGWPSAPVLAISWSLGTLEGKKEVKSLSRVRLFVTPWTAAHQASPSMGFSRQEHWSGLPFPSPEDIRNLWLMIGTWLHLSSHWIQGLMICLSYFC